MSENFVSAEELNVATVNGEINAASVEGTMGVSSILGGIEIAGVVIEESPDIPIATTERLGGVIIGDHLNITEEGRVSVTVASSPEDDNTDPISAAAVYTEIGNINALLATI